MADITMPQLGETVTEGTITKWFKQVGDQIAEDEVLFEVSTDKVDSEVPAPTGGYVTEILVQEGDTVDVGTKLAVISDSPPGEGGGSGSTDEGTATEEDSSDEGAEQGQEPEPEQGQEPEPEQGQEPEPASAAPKPPPKLKSVPQPAPKSGKRSTSDGARSGARSTLLSPVVRRLITEHGLDPTAIAGSGAGGRITRNDVLTLVEREEGGAAPAPTPAATAAAAAPEPAREVAAPAAPGERDTAVPLSNIRKRTAEHMVRSLQTSAHVYASIEVDYEAVEVVRRAHKEQWKAAEGFGLTYLPFVSRAVVDAIAEFPQVNATLAGPDLVLHNYVNLGIAVDLEFNGLIVPVVRDADAKRLRAIARDVSDLARRARAKKLSADEISGGTFTITNPGPYGTLLTLPIINQPQVAILSTDGVRRRPVVVDLPDGTEAIAIHSVGNLALTWDHRAFDGAYASAFLAKVRAVLESRDWAAEL